MGVADPQALIASLEPLFYSSKVGLHEPKIKLLPDFTPVVFNPANQIIHPAVYWAHFRQYDGVHAVPKNSKFAPGEWLYRGMSETAGICLETLDEELQGIKDVFFEATGAQGCKLVIPLRRIFTERGDYIRHDPRGLVAFG